MRVELAPRALLAALPLVLAGESVAVPQAEEAATLAPKIAKSDAPLAWQAPAVVLERRIRGFNPWPVAEALLDDGRRLRIWDAVALPGGQHNATPGTLLAISRAGVDVATGAGVLRLLKVQPPSARVMDIAAYLAAHSLVGASFAT